MQGDGARTSVTVDFGDGHALTYSNVSSIEDGIKHIYKSVGIYRVTATGENSLGSETATLFLHVTCEFLLKNNNNNTKTSAFIHGGLSSIFLIFLFFPLFITLCGIAAVTSPRSGLYLLRTRPESNKQTQIEQTSLRFLSSQQLPRMDEA